MKAIIVYYIKNKSDVFTKLVPQGNITVVHRSTNVMMSVRKCIRFCIPELQSRPEVYMLLYLTLYKIKVMFLQNWHPQGNITVHRSTNVMFHVCPEMYPFLHSGIKILTGS
jgi:hypothetical protein